MQNPIQPDAFTPAVGADGLEPTSDFRVFLRWSADGSRLAVMDANLGGVITVWGAGARCHECKLVSKGAAIIMIAAPLLIVASVR